MPPRVYSKAANAYLAANGGRLIAGEGVGGDDAAQEPHPWSDAWLLLAIKYAQGNRPSAELEQIIAAGDGINHAIFTDAELHGGFARLAGGGFILAEGATCAVSRQFLDAWSKAGADKRRQMAKQLEIVEAILADRPVSGE